MWRKLQTAWRLSPRARSQFLSAYGLLLLVTLSMQWKGLRWTSRWLQRGVKIRSGKPSPYNSIPPHSSAHPSTHPALTRTPPRRGFLKHDLLLGGVPAGGGGSADAHATNGQMQTAIKTTFAMVRLAARYSPWSNCIRQSLTLWTLLRWQGIDTDLQIGTRRVNGKFESHAWLEYQGQIVGDRADVRQQYQAFSQAIEY